MIQLGSPAPTRAPRLESARLVLAGHTLADLGDCTAMWGDPIVTRHIGGRPFTPEEVWGRLHRYIGHWALLGFGYWALREKATGRYVGELGFADFRRPISPPFGDTPEAGWTLAPWAHGKGLATEGMLAALRWADASFGHRATGCMIHPENAASLRVAERCGYTQNASAVYHGEPSLIFRREPNAASSSAAGPTPIVR